MDDLEKIINVLYPNFWQFANLSLFKQDNVLGCYGKKNVDWREPGIVMINWEKTKMIVQIAQEEFCGSTCDNQGICNYGHPETRINLDIDYTSLKLFLKSHKTLVIEMIDHVPDVVASLSGKTLKQVKDWQYEQYMPDKINTWGTYSLR